MLKILPIMLLSSAQNFDLLCSILCSCVHYKTHSSEPRGQEEAGLRDEPVSYLQVALL